MSSTTPPILSASNAEHVAGTCAAYALTPDDFATLSSQSAQAKAQAYCPYSKFRVGAAVLTASPTGGPSGDGPASEDPTIGAGEGNGGATVGAGAGILESRCITGCNVENASYPVGTCAERVAIGRAVAEGYTRFKAIGVSTDISPPASPCGMCRQFIREFLPLDAPIIMFDKNQDYVVLRLEQLLPLSFGPEALLPAEA